MIRRISSLCAGLAVSFASMSAFAQDQPTPETVPATNAPPDSPGAADVGDGGGEMATGFAKAGQFVISSDLELRITSTSSKAPSGPDPDSSTTIVIGPALDYFVIDGLTVGAQIVYTRVSSGDFSASLFGVGPRVGYAIPLAEMLSVWPRANFTYLTGSSESPSSTGGTTDRSQSRMSIGVYVPLLIHPAEHFFVGLGPVFSTDLSSKVEDADADKTTTFGAVSTVGGWF